jgi:hypothetical protein
LYWFLSSARPLVQSVSSTRLGSSLSDEGGVCGALLVLHSSIVWNNGGDEELVLFSNKYWNAFEDLLRDTLK